MRNKKKIKKKTIAEKYHKKKKTIRSSVQLNQTDSNIDISTDLSNPVSLFISVNLSILTYLSISVDPSISADLFQLSINIIQFQNYKYSRIIIFQSNKNTVENNNSSEFFSLLLFSSIFSSFFLFFDNNISISDPEINSVK